MKKWIGLWMCAASALVSEAGFDWMPPEATNASLGAAGEGGGIVPDITITPTPKATANRAAFTNEYVIDLKAFGISNEGTRPVETSLGINRALQAAGTSGVNRIVFPKGVYLIGETNPVVINLQDTIIDLNGATLQIQSNGLLKYAVVVFEDGARNVRLCNGTLKGDRQTHDYLTVKGTHEWGACLSFAGGRDLEADHLRLIDATGDGVSSGTTGARTRPDLLAKIMHSVYIRDLEPGAFSEKGTKAESATKMRTIKPYAIAACGGAFEFGYSAGMMGYPFIRSRQYQACFYDKGMTFLGKKNLLQYRKAVVPEGAAFMHLEFNQPSVSEAPAHTGAARGWIARITNFRPPADVHFHHNLVSNDRRLGMAFCGGQRWVIEENLFEGNGGTAPAFGVDFEDGWELMQDVVFRNNRFKGNKGGDLVVCAGSELLFEGNEFEKVVSLAGRPHNYEFRKNRFLGGVHYETRTGVASIHDNVYSNGPVTVSFDTKAVADGLFRAEGQTVATPPLLLENETLVDIGRLTGTYLNFANSTMKSVKMVAGKETRLIRLKNVSFADCSIFYETNGPAVKTVIENATGECREEGPGLKRKNASAP